jgi:hypothetical protein
MAFSKTNVTLENLTLELARQFAAMPGLPGERPLRDGRLSFLNKERLEGRFVSPGWAVVLDTTTGTRYRLNGQHSSTMLARLEADAFPAGLLVTIEEFSTTDLAHDGLHMFNLFDHPRAARSNTDIMGLYRARYPELAGIELSLLVNLCNGISQHEVNRADQNLLSEIHQPRERGVYLMRPEIRAFVLWAAPFEEEIHGWMLHKAGIVAEMFSNVQMDQPAAQEFWRLVLTESHPDQEHETRELSRNLKDLLPKPRIGQERLQKEAAKFWRRYRRSLQAIAA